MEEWRQEREMRYEANEKEEEARRMLHRAWKEARRLEDNATWEGERFRDAGDEIYHRGARRKETIKDALYLMMAIVTRQVVAMREEAVQMYNEMMADVRKLRERAYDSWVDRQEKEEEKKREKEAQKETPAPTQKLVGTVSPKLVPALKWTLQEEQPESPNPPPLVETAAAAAGRSGDIVDWRAA